MPSFEQLEQLARAEASPAELAQDGDEHESPRERSLRVLFLRYLGSLPPHFNRIDPDAVNRAIGTYLDHVEARDVIAKSKSRDEAPVSPPTPPPFSSPPAVHVPRAQKTRQWIVAVAAGFGLAAAVAVTSASLQGRLPLPAAVVSATPPVEIPRATAESPAGETPVPQGTAAVPQGTAAVPQGTAVVPQGTAVVPQGTAVVPKTLTVPQKPKPAAQPTAPVASSSHGGGSPAPKPKQSVLPSNAPRPKTPSSPVSPAPKWGF